MILNGYVDQLTSAFDEIDEDNFHDMNLLVRFARSKFLANIASVDEGRKCNEFFCRGINLEKTLPEEDSDAMGLFFESELEAIVRGKGSARVKQ